MPEAPSFVPVTPHWRALPRAPGVTLGQALRHALSVGGGRVVLQVGAAAPHRHESARRLLQEGALAAGGQVLDGPGGDLLLVGAEQGRAGRLRDLLDRLVGPQATLLWSLERDAEALLAYAAGGSLPAPRMAGLGPSLAGLDPCLDAMPLAGATRRMRGLPASEAGSPFLRLEASREAIAAALGALGDDPDLMDHAMRRIAARLPEALAEPSSARELLGPHRWARLHLPLAGVPGPGMRMPPGMLFATLPLAAAADPEALAAHAAALAEAGIGLELDGLGAEALALLDPSGLPGAMLRLHWSRALGAMPLAELRRLDPARLILAGADGREAHGFAAALGIAFVEAPA